MPTVLKVDGFRFHFYSKEENEPPHIHVSKDDLEAKFWLEPVQLSKNYGFSTVELNKIAKLVNCNRSMLLMAYMEFHGL